jgi:hypothetical protein
MAGSLKEKDVWKHFRKTWPWHAERQEPGASFDAGKPDVLLVDKYGTAGLVELKAPTRWKLRPSQWIWHERWVTAKGRSCIVTCEMYDGEKEPVWYVCNMTPLIIKANKLLKSEVAHDKLVQIVCVHLKIGAFRHGA